MFICRGLEQICRLINVVTKMTTPKERAVLNRINLSTQRLFAGSEVWGEGSFTSDSYDVAGRVRDCALASFAEPFARRNAVSSAANGA